MSHGLPRRHSQYGLTSSPIIPGEFPDGRDKIYELAYRVWWQGNRTTSRYGATQELTGVQLRVPSRTLVTRDKLNMSFGWMEMFQLLGGFFDPELLKRVAPNADHSLITPQMAYGPRIQDQMIGIIQTLTLDPLSRQAVLFIGHPDDGPTSDLPCTLTIQFLQRLEIIDAIVTMRSWDLCRGLPYDLMMFSGLLEALARCLNKTTGHIYVTAGSAHVYHGWEDKTPRTSLLKWNFKYEVPRSWLDIRDWAQAAALDLEKGKSPLGIEIT